jgi:hypothetical protein
MDEATRQQQAEEWLYDRLATILGPKRRGLASYGLRYDPKQRAVYLGVDLEPDVPANVIDRVPKDVDQIPVRVRRISLQLE